MKEWQLRNAEYVEEHGLTSRKRQVSEPDVPIQLEAGKVYGTADLPGIELAPGVRARVCWGRGTLLEWLEMAPGSLYPDQTMTGELITAVQQGSATCTVDGEAMTLEDRSLLYLEEGAQRSLQAGSDGLVAMEVFSPVVAEHLALAGTELATDANAGFPDQGIEPNLQAGRVYAMDELKRSPIVLPGSEPDAPPVAHTTLVWVRNFMLSLIRMDGNCFFPHHFHPEDQLMIVLKGAMKEGIIDEWHEMADQDVIWQPGGLVHAARVSPEGVDVVDVFWPVRPDYMAMVQ